MAKTSNKNINKGGKGENKVPENGLDYEFFGNERNYHSADVDGVEGGAVILDAARRVGLVSLFSAQEIE